MISVPTALSIISNTPCITRTLKLPIKEVNGLIVSKDINSPIHMPPFRQSAMDGYAVWKADKDSYEIIGEVKAGDSNDYALQPGQGVRIFTGARVPDQADTVIIQEHVVKTENIISVAKEIRKNQNIRPVGEQIQKGTIAITKGTQLTPAAIGFLAGIGITEVEVYTPPKVGIITTGNELIRPGEELSEGKIYESNSIQLQAVLKQYQVRNIRTYNVQDEFQQTKETIQQSIRENDLVLISGGISVGDYDFVKQALEELLTEELFYKIKQKPGKPLYFGANNNTLIFALPGNPASSLTCFYIYVLPIIQKMMGSAQIGLNKTKKTITIDYTKKGERAEFLKAKVYEDTVEVLDGQSSSMLYTYAVANALVYIPEEVNEITKGSLVETFLLPN